MAELVLDGGTTDVDDAVTVETIEDRVELEMIGEIDWTDVVEDVCDDLTVEATIEPLDVPAPDPAELGLNEEELRKDVVTEDEGGR